MKTVLYLLAIGIHRTFSEIYREPSKSGSFAANSLNTDVFSIPHFSPLMPYLYKISFTSEIRYSSPSATG